MQFCLHFGDGKEELVRGIIEKLSDGGRFNYHGATHWSPLVAGIVDRFSVCWCILSERYGGGYKANSYYISVFKYSSSLARFLII